MTSTMEPSPAPPGAEHAREWGRRPPMPEQIRFLHGPQKRRFELGQALQIFIELIRGFRTLHFVGPCATVFGSARFTQDHPYYAMARDVGAKLASAGYTVMTGGGPGIMEAANRGAKDVGGRSLGCNIQLEHEQLPNAYLDKWITFRHFYVRKLMLVKYSYAFIVMPGGFGTLDEFYETATLIQTHKIAEFPLIFMGVDYWTPLFDFMRQRLVAERTIDAADLDRLVLTDSVEEAVLAATTIGMKRFGLTYGPKIKRRWLLGE